MPGALEIGLLVFVIILLFGAKKIPDFATGLGQGIKNFKKEIKEIKKETSENFKEEVKEIEKLKD